MTDMKKILLILATCLLGTAVTAQNPDAVYKLLRYEWTANADGTSDYHYRHEVQILRNRALVAYADKGETFVVYNPDLEELTINEVYTLRADGSRVDMPQNAFVYQLPSQCADCGRFNHLRELAMVHTGMELGCTIVVDYTIHRLYNLLYENIPLMRDCPVEKLEVVVNYNHNDMELNYSIDGLQYLNSDDVTRSSSINTDGMTRALHYTFVNMPQAPREPYMPADIVPTLHIYNGIPEFVPAFDTKGLAEAQTATGKLLGGSNAKENIELLRNFVVDDIHLNDIAPAKLGYKHSTAAEVWQTGCGTATDKAVLLAALLNQWSYPARVIGEQSDEVGVIIDTLEYCLSVRNKSSMSLIGEAKEEVSKQNIKTTADPAFDTLADGFFRLRLPGVPGGPNVDVKRLALSRTTPLQSTACELKSDITIALPANMKMVGAAVNRTLSYDGVGSVEISVKQSGKKLRVIRNMQLEKSVIAPADYAHYRELLTLWQGISEVLMRTK